MLVLKSRPVVILSIPSLLQREKYIIRLVSSGAQAHEADAVSREMIFGAYDSEMI
jgi:hypothetical protein